MGITAAYPPSPYPPKGPYEAPEDAKASALCTEGARTWMNYQAGPWNPT